MTEIITGYLESLDFKYDVSMENKEVYLNEFLTFNKIKKILLNDDVIKIGESKNCISSEEIKSFKIQRKLESFKNTKNQTIINLFLNKNCLHNFSYWYKEKATIDERILIKINTEDEQFLKTKLIKTLKFDKEIFKLKLAAILFYKTGKIVACFDYNEKTSEIVKKFNKEKYPEVDDEKFIEKFPDSMLLIDKNSFVTIIYKNK